MTAECIFGLAGLSVMGTGFVVICNIAIILRIDLSYVYRNIQALK